MVLLVVFAACSKPAQKIVQAPPSPWKPPQLARFRPMQVPPENPLTREKVELGRKLFSDPRLSADGSRTCAGCHEPKYGFTIGAIDGRACASLINVGYAQGFFGEDAPIPLERAVQGMWQFAMVRKDGPTLDEVAARFGPDVTPQKVTDALASYLRTLVPVNAPWVRFHDGDATALSEKARRGYEVFDRKARCTNCHNGVLLTDRLRHDIGTGSPYKTPTLLNIGKSMPYFHDHRVAKLEEAVDRMLAGGFKTKSPDPQLRPVTLTPEERELLLAFLRELDADVM